MKKILVILSTFIVFAPDAIYAGDTSRRLSAGATFGDVLSLWGEPVEKVEKRVRREVVWYYPNRAKVVFKDGKVKTWQQTELTARAQQDNHSYKFEKSDARREPDAGTQELMHDIIKDIPSMPEIAQVEQPDLQPQASQPPLVPNQFPPGGKGAPPGLAPGGDANTDLED